MVRSSRFGLRHPLSLVIVLAVILEAPMLRAQQPADLILHNGKVLTVDGNFTIVQAVAIRGNRIAGVGTNTEILQLRGAGSTVVDLKGRTVIPGLIDTHQHIHNYAEGSYGAALTPEQRGVYDLDWRGVRTKEDVLNQIRGVMAKYKFQPGQWVYLNNVGASDSAELIKILYDELDRWNLSTVTPDNPVALDLTIPDFNGYLVNDAGMKILLDKHGAFMTKYGRFWIDNSGRPDGHLEPPAARLMLQYLPTPPPADVAPIYKKYLEEMAATGLTTVSTRLPVYSKGAFELLRSQGQLTARVGGGMQDVFGNLSELDIDQGLRKYSGIAGQGDDVMWVTSVAPTAIDGGGTRACTNEKRQGQLEVIDGWWPMGQCHTDQEFRGAAGRSGPIQANYFREWVFSSGKNNVRFANTHTAGDRSVKNMLDIIEQIQRQHGRDATKDWAMDHCRYVDPADMPRAARLGVAFSCAPKYIQSGASVAKAYNERMAQTMIVPVGAMIKAGVKVVYEADRDNYTWDDLEILLTRKDRQGKVWGEQDKVDKATALRMITRWAADYVLKGDKLGSLETGKLADLVVLDKDYMAMPADDVSTMRPQMTIFDGKIIFLTPQLSAEQNLKPAGALVATYDELHSRRPEGSRSLDF
jgi:predicted amidohydrolase YtcJ